VVPRRASETREVLDLHVLEITVFDVHPSRSHRSGGRGRYILGALLLGAAVSTACFVLLVRGSQTGSVDTNVTRAFTLMIERCAGNSKCVETETANLVVATSPVDVAAAAIEVYRENPQAVPACHTYMHLLGAHLTAMVVTGDAPALGETWTDCGAGLVHGAFENIEFDPADSNRIAEIVALCDGREFAEPLPRHHSCLHAVGHGIHSAVGGDLRRGEDLCMRAIPDEVSFTRNHPCLAGVYMVDRDERVDALDAPVTVEGWADLLNHCSTSPRPEVCTSSYFEIATRNGRLEALSYLDWCLTASAEDVCLLLLGQGATFRELFGVSKELDATTCLTAATERGLATAPCLDGSRRALAASGTSSEELESALCRLLQAGGVSCPPRNETSLLDDESGE
jgi:hypothetical protein